MVRATAGVALARRLLSGAAATLLFSCSQAACGQVPAKSPGTAHSSRSVRGILVSRAGLPVSNAMVAVVGHSIWDGIKTDRQGRFEVKQVPSDAKAVLAYSQRSDRMAVIPTSPWPAGEQVYVLDCDAVQVVGRVVDRDRRAVQGRSPLSMSRHPVGFPIRRKSTRRPGRMARSSPITCPRHRVGRSALRSPVVSRLRRSPYSARRPLFCPTSCRRRRQILRASRWRRSLNTQADSSTNRASRSPVSG